MNEPNNKYQPDMDKLRTELGRTPAPAPVARLEDFAPKAKSQPAGAAIMKSQHILDGLRELVHELHTIATALHGTNEAEPEATATPPGLLDVLDIQARYLARAQALVSDVRQIVL